MVTQPREQKPAEPPATLKVRAEKLWQTHQVSLFVAGVAVFSYAGVLWLRPLWLLKLPARDIALPFISWQVPLGFLKVLKYRDRVLDTWVEQHWKTAEAEFLKLPTVAERAIYIELPVYLNDVLVESFGGEDLSATFAKNSALLLISGEGGAGKTALACQVGQWGLQKKLARHRLLPVLIETELSEQRTLIEAIRGQLNALTNQREPIPPELLDRLLHRRRILVIVDHFSEMGAATRQQVTPNLAEFSAKALVITSRLEESFGREMPRTLLKPMRIEGSRLSQFLDAYLAKQQKRDLFEDEDYFDACRRLSRMVGQRNITLLLAKLYADQMIEQQGGAGGILPASVPELMLSYLNQLNRSIEPENQRDRLTVRQDAQQVAWACLRQTYRPAAAAKEGPAGVLAALTAPDGPSAQAKLDYLENRLRLLQTPEPGDTVRIVLDPLAEYLAALQLVDDCRDQPEARWEEFLDSIDPLLARTNDPPEAIQGFLLAVRDCCLLKQTEAKVPDSVPERLARKAGLDPEDLRRTEEKRRIRLLISDLSAPELEYRIRAAEDLGKRGVGAAAAVPNLLGMVENLNQPLESRQAATAALGKLGLSCDSLRQTIAPRLLTLLRQEEDLAVGRSLAEALGTMKAGQTELLAILQSEDQPPGLRQGAARALSLVGAPSGEAVPMLIVELTRDQVKTQVKSIPVWREVLPEVLQLELVSIPGGKFVMGSPPDEVGRDYYPYSFPETEGIDVEMQHPVTVQPFMMSRYPITQAQWRAIATLPKINRDLEPDPASFKDDNRPVEQVTWAEAVEFCDRLSAHTGKPYRLPSEAEWEYACRAGTTSAFHLGDTLSTELANYDGNYTYGEGSAGLYRQKTTEVGSFGLVNAFGLADMHGNVLEWCQDHWHPSYEGAPTDGSAWVTDGDERYRMVRGGSWFNNPDICRSSFRYRNTRNNQNNYLGFRVVSVPSWTL
jgi:formylglycine-generating enzyme required for sulfatase activity